MSQTLRLVADVGGTNIRLAFARGTDLDRESLRSVPCDGFGGLEEAVRDYLAQWPNEPALAEACIAIAGPVDGDFIRMTNRDWAFSIDAMQAALGLRRLVVVNDFVAVSMAVPELETGQWTDIGPATQARPNSTIAVLGPGTGLGVGALVPNGGSWLPVATEGGHASFAPADAQEIELLQVLARDESPVTLERILCGPGLENLYAAYCEIEGRAAVPVQAAEIVAGALGSADRLHVRVLNRFCAMLGTAAGNLALTLGAKGGVFLGGGILPRMVEFLAASPFRQRFEWQESGYREYVAAIPTRLITEKDVGLIGALACLSRR